ncbi:MAG: transglycosylase SLT domain-containing protein, partial [Nanoarchaeota archaeon]
MSNPFIYGTKEFKIHNLRELYEELRITEEENFKKHVDGNKNDYANWIESSLGDRELAKELRKKTSLRETRELIGSRLRQYEEQQRRNFNDKVGIDTFKRMWEEGEKRRKDNWEKQKPSKYGYFSDAEEIKDFDREWEEGEKRKKDNWEKQKPSNSGANTKNLPARRVFEGEHIEPEDKPQPGYIDGRTYTMAGLLEPREQEKFIGEGRTQAASKDRNNTPANFQPQPVYVESNGDNGGQQALPPGKGSGGGGEGPPHGDQGSPPPKGPGWKRPGWLRRPGSFARPDRVQYGFILILAALFLHAIKYVMLFDYSVLWMLDVFFAFIVFYIIFSSEERETRGFRAILVILLLETLFPMALSFLENNFDVIAGNQFIHYYLANRLLTPWWLYYAIIRANDCKNPNKASVISKIILAVFWIGVLFSIPAVSIEKIDTQEFITHQQTDTLWDFVGKFWSFWWEGVITTIFEGIQNLLVSIWNSFQQGLDTATGGYYSGMVDRNENQRLGVYFEEVEPTARKFAYTGPVSVYGILDILSLNDAVRLNLSCHQDGRDACEVYPDEPQWYYRHQREQLDCKFSQKRLKPGNHEINLEADFNFETMAYQKGYFMDQETKRSLIAEGKDPLEEYEITDTDPDAIFTNGPVMIGMDIIAGQPIEVEAGGIKRPAFGVTIDRNHGWEGYIEELEELVIQVPDSMEVLAETCTYNFIELEEGDETIEEFVKGYRKYRSSQFRDCQNQVGLRAEDFDDSGEINNNSLKDKDYSEEEIKNKKKDMKSCLREHAEMETDGHRTYVLDVDRYDEEFKDIKSHKTFNCRLNLEEANEILGGSPLAIHNIRAKARYQYKLEENVDVRVEGEVEDVPEPGSVGARALSYEYWDIAEDVVQKYNEEMELGIDDDEEDSLLTPCLIMGIIAVESSSQADAVGGDGERGLMQVMPSTAEETIEKLDEEEWFTEKFGDVGEEILNDYNGFDPEHSLIVGTYYLAKKLETKSKVDWKDVENPREDAIKYSLGEYNAGAGNSKLRECQKGSAEQFSDCGEKYTEDIDFLPDSHGREYTHKIWNTKQECKLKKSSPLDQERDDEKAKWLTQEKEFKISFSNDSVEECITGEWERFNDTIETEINKIPDDYEDDKAELEGEKKEGLNVSLIKDVLNNILEDTSKEPREHWPGKWDGEHSKEYYEEQAAECVLNKNLNVVLKENGKEIDNPYKVELGETR